MLRASSPKPTKRRSTRIAELAAKKKRERSRSPSAARASSPLRSRGEEDKTQNFTITNVVLPPSDLIAAAIRGLTGPTQPPPGCFCYTNCLRREYDSKNQNIRSVTFNISRYGKYKKTLHFATPTSEAFAIAAVENYLSRPLTQAYYTRIQKDLFHEMPWEEAKYTFQCRGDTLTDAKFLERVWIGTDGHLTFSIVTSIMDEMSVGEMEYKVLVSHGHIETEKSPDLKDASPEIGIATTDVPARQYLRGKRKTYNEVNAAKSSMTPWEAKGGNEEKVEPCLVAAVAVKAAGNCARVASEVAGWCLNASAKKRLRTLGQFVEACRTIEQTAKEMQRAALARERAASSSAAAPSLSDHSRRERDPVMALDEDHVNAKAGLETTPKTAPEGNLAGEIDVRDRLDDDIRLVVGGQMFLTTRRTVLGIPGSLLANTFGLHFAEPPGRLLSLDLNPKRFGLWLDYMRTGDLAILIPHMDNLGPQLRADARLMGLTEAENAIDMFHGRCDACQVSRIDLLPLHMRYIRLKKERGPPKPGEGKTEAIEHEVEEPNPLICTAAGAHRTHLYVNSEIEFKDEKDDVVLRGIMVPNEDLHVKLRVRVLAHSLTTEGVKKRQLDRMIGKECSVRKRDVTRILVCGHAGCKLDAGPTCRGFHRWRRSALRIEKNSHITGTSFTI